MFLDLASFKHTSLCPFRTRDRGLQRRLPTNGIVARSRRFSKWLMAHSFSHRQAIHTSLYPSQARVTKGQRSTDEQRAPSRALNAQLQCFPSQFNPRNRCIDDSVQQKLAMICCKGVLDRAKPRFQPQKQSHGQSKDRQCLCFSFPLPCSRKPSP
jgi:hypothetical protein